MDRNAIGRESKPAINEVEKGSIRKFAEAIGETNPIYFEEAAARAAGYRSVVAPPTFPTTLRAPSGLTDVVVIEDEGRDESQDVVYRSRQLWVVRMAPKTAPGDLHE